MSITYKKLIMEFKKGTTLAELAEREGIGVDELKAQIYKVMANKKSVKDIIAKLESNEKNKEKKSRMKKTSEKTSEKTPEEISEEIPEKTPEEISEEIVEEIPEKNMEDGTNENSERIEALHTEISKRLERISALETLVERNNRKLKDVKEILAVEYAGMQEIVEQFENLMKRINPLIEQFNSVQSEMEMKNAELDTEKTEIDKLQKELQELTAILLTEEEIENNSLERSEVNEAIHLLFDFVDEKTTISDIRKIASWMLVIDKTAANTGRTVTAIFEEKNVVAETLISLGYSVTIK